MLQGTRLRSNFICHAIIPTRTPNENEGVLCLRRRQVWPDGRLKRLF